MLIINFEQVCGHVVNILYSLGIFNTYPQIKSNKNWLGSKFVSKQCTKNEVFLRIWSHLLKKSLMENFNFYAVLQNGYNTLSGIHAFQINVLFLSSLKTSKTSNIFSDNLRSIEKEYWQMQGLIYQWRAWE